MSCERAREIQLYYDGEVALEQRAAIESHLKECAACGALLAELQGLSQALRIAPMTPMPAGAVDRLQASWRKARDRGVLRIAEWLTGAAAAVLIAALWLHTPQRDQAASAPLWQTVAVMPPVETAEDNAEDLTVLAQWMADDLSSGGLVK